MSLQMGIMLPIPSISGPSKGNFCLMKEMQAASNDVLSHGLYINSIHMGSRRFMGSKAASHLGKPHFEVSHILPRSHRGAGRQDVLDERVWFIFRVPKKRGPGIQSYLVSHL